MPDPIDAARWRREAEDIVCFLQREEAAGLDPLKTAIRIDWPRLPARVLALLDERERLREALAKHLVAQAWHGSHHECLACKGSGPTPPRVRHAPTCLLYTPTEGESDG